MEYIYVVSNFVPNTSKIYFKKHMIQGVLNIGA